MHITKKTTISNNHLASKPNTNWKREDMCCAAAVNRTFHHLEEKCRKLNPIGKSESAKIAHRICSAVINKAIPRHPKHSDRLAICDRNQLSLLDQLRPSPYLTSKNRKKASSAHFFSFHTHAHTPSCSLVLTTVS